MEGLKNADEIVKVPGVHAIFAVSSEFGNFGGYKQGDPNYERKTTSCTTQRTKSA
jgi:hypothetical protein